MKILKPGKVEQWKLVCPKCGCIFVANATDFKYRNYSKCVICPQEGCERNFIVHPDDGEPYEEPTHDADAIERLADLIYDGCTTDGETAWEIAKHLTENGVTFREG